jgi:hypothetical protein
MALDYLWLKPIVYPSSQPKTNGEHCPPPIVHSNISRPDYIVSHWPPKELRQEQHAWKRAWLIGDFKISGNTIYKKYFQPEKPSNQWSAMVHFAQGYQYAPVILFVTFFAGDDHFRHTMTKKALKRGLAVVVVSIR